MTGHESTKAIAEALTRAMMLVSNSSFIVAAIDGRKDRELTKEEIELLRDYLPSAEDDLRAVAVALIEHGLWKVVGE